MMTRKNLVLFDHGTENSLLIMEDLLKKSKDGHFAFYLKAVVSTKKYPMYDMAKELDIPFYYFQNDEDYQEIAKTTKGDLFLFYNWEKEITNFDEKSNFKKSNTVCIFPGPHYLKNDEISNVCQHVISDISFNSSSFTVYFYGENKNDVSKVFAYMNVPINNCRDALTLERKIIKAGICKLGALLESIAKSQISVNEKGCLNLPEKWVKEYARVNLK